MMKIEGSGSISQRHGFEDTDPEPHQNVMDPQHCIKFSGKNFRSNGQMVCQLYFQMFDRSVSCEYRYMLGRYCLTY
jgi:hypothetical protein